MGSGTLPPGDASPPGPGVCALRAGGLLSLGSLFAGLGNFERGLGLPCAWQVESEPFRRRILSERFGAELIEDVREASGLPKADVLCGGFPCQDLSVAGQGAGIEGARSSLWREFARIIGEQQPRLVFIENVPALLNRGFDLVVADLCEQGFSVEWDCIPAASVGAPHLRDRLWVVAYRGPGPCIFGPPNRFYFVRPGGQRGSAWRRWPRAGFAQGAPDEYLGLEPLAPIGPAKRGARLPTPSRTRYGSSQNGINGVGGEHERPSAGSPSLDQMARTGPWPTPTFGERAAGSRNLPGSRAHPGVSLTDAVRFGNSETPRMPTPNARDHKGRDMPGRHHRASGSGRSLGHLAATGLWPTPRSSGDHETGGGEAATYRRTPSQKERGHGLYLQSEVGEAEIAEGREPGQLNPDWVEWLMGMPCGWSDPERSNDDLHWQDWSAEPCPRIAEGVKDRTARLSAIGDSLVAAIPAWIASRIPSEVIGG